MQGSSYISRRELLEWSTWGLTGTALTSLVQAGPRPAISHFPARAKRVIHVVLMGGLSHIDSFDYKPELEKFHGKPLKYKAVSYTHLTLPTILLV